jgi:hypothetical protein
MTRGDGTDPFAQGCQHDPVQEGTLSFRLDGLNGLHDRLDTLQGHGLAPLGDGLAALELT